MLIKSVIHVLALTLAMSVGLPSVAAAACKRLPLIFNARSGVWEIKDATCKDSVDFDINGRPTVYVKETVRVSVTIENINPLAYNAHYGEVSVASIEGLADLQALLTSAGGLTRLLLNPNAADLPRGATDPKLTALEKAYDELIGGLRNLDSERDRVVRAAQRLEQEQAVIVTTPNSTIGSLETLYTNLRTALQNAGKDADAETVTAVDKALASHGKAMKAVASMHLALAPYCRQTCPGGISISVSNTIALDDIIRASAWDKIATYPITITRTGLLADDIVTTMPKEVSTNLKVAAPQALLLGAAVGVITTTVSSKTWTAVADPNNKDRKVITQTDEDRISAVPALIGTYAFSQANARRPSRPMLEFGSSLNTDKSAWFIGGGVSVGGGLRLGVGLVAARVKKLDGQKPDDVVADNNAIKTKSGWNGGVYFSFGLSLSSLNLFSKG